MTTQINRLGETETKWTSHQHPDNPDFMQVVNWCVWEKDGKTTVCYHLQDPKNAHFIYGITKDEAIERFTDKPVVEITEADFLDWLMIHDGKFNSPLSGNIIV